MQENDNITPASLNIETEVVDEKVVETPGTKIVQTDVGNKDGQEKCPKCGSTEITTNTKTGKLRCVYCRFEFDGQKVEGLEEDIKNLKGVVVGSGASDIVADTNNVITLKCTSCGAEVVIDTASVTQARCHWCRNTLSIQQQIPNGAVPDVVLGFKVTKDDARGIIEKFVNKRKFYAFPKFTQEFTTENIMGVYFPYMIVDINSHATLTGQGEHKVRSYMVQNGDRKEVRYDADLYDVSREYDLAITGLTVESNKDRLNNTSSAETNNVINAIMPFDIENCVKYDANYLRGFTSERRNTDINDIKPLVVEQAKDISRFAANSTLETYDRGVRWDSENLDIIGEQWKTAYLPVWLYSYQQVNGNKKILHYVAVNARTKEVMGSVPIHMPKLLLVSFLLEILGIILMIATMDNFNYSFLFLLIGFIYFFVIYSKYRNGAARHKHESETKKEMSNVKKGDRLVRHYTGLSNASMHGANNRSVKGSTNFNSKIVEGILNKNK